VTDPDARLYKKAPGAAAILCFHGHKINRLDELLPWNWTPMATTQAEAA
jgi:hypothetical protein